MKPVLWFALLVLVPLATSQEGQMDVKKRLPIIQTGKLECAPAGKKTVWKAVTPSGDPRKCTVTVNYQGSENCKAWFGKTGFSSGTPETGATWKKGQKVTDATSLDFHCEGPKGGECRFAIRQVDCGPGKADAEPRTGSSLHHPQPRCSESGELFDAPISGERCNVTVRYRGTEACKAFLWEKDDHTEIDSTSTNLDQAVVTVQDVHSLRGRCEGLARGRCDFEVLETECPAH